MSSVEIPENLSYENMRNQFTNSALLDIKATNVYGSFNKKYTDGRFKTTVLKKKHHVIRNAS